MIMITSQVFATTYYVDATTGNDNNSGTSPATAWKTIAKVNNSYFNPGDSILFKRGEVWREQLNVPSSGSPSNPIIFGAYGSGNVSIISGADLITGWSLHRTNIWKASCSSVYTPYVTFNRVKGNKQTSLANVDSDKDYYWDSSSNILYVYSTSNPDTSYTNPGIEAAVRASCITIDKAYITIENLHLMHANNPYIGNITIKKNNIVVNNCTVEFGANIGIYIDQQNGSTNYLEVKNCTIRY